MIVEQTHQQKWFNTSILSSFLQAGRDKTTFKCALISEFNLGHKRWQNNLALYSNQPISFKIRHLITFLALYVVFPKYHKSFVLWMQNNKAPVFRVFSLFQWSWIFQTILLFPFITKLLPLPSSGLWTLESITSINYCCTNQSEGEILIGTC